MVKKLLPICDERGKDQMACSLFVGRFFVLPLGIYGV